MILSRKQSPERSPLSAPQRTKPSVHIPVDGLFQILIECRDEKQQRALYDRLTAEGIKCRLLIL